MTETPLDVTSLLGPEGPIARRLEGFEARPQQLALSLAVERALKHGKHLVAEAGTGTGKSFAYLLPAAMHADQHQGDGPVVISTRTIALQEQLERKDLPFLHAVLPFEWSSVTAIGRNNYLCLRRMHQAERDQQGLFDDPERHAQMRKIVDWSLNAGDGTRQELDSPPRPEVWEAVQAEHGNCLQRACKHYDQCYWQRARRRMQTAQVLVVNHALYFADLALRIAGASYLPAHRVVIFDEAHHLERTATESLGLRLGRTTVSWHLRRIHKRRGERTLLSRHGSGAAKLLWEEAQQLNDAFFDALQGRVQPGGAQSDSVALHGEVIQETLSPVLRALSLELSSAATRAEQVDAQMELQARASGLDSLCQMLKALCTPNPDAETPLVRWLEPSRRGPQLCAAPLDVSAALRQHLFEGGATTILTSATLATGDDDQFSWMRKQIGLDQTETLRVGSPFDYDRAVDFVIEEAMPDPSRESHSYRREVTERCERHILENGGRALILCTSWDFVRFLAQQLRPACNAEGVELLVQGEQPLARLLERKRDEATSVLIGTDSLWEGIDVPGDALTLLVVTRLPFASPGHPLTQARMDLMKQRGQEPFGEHSLPEAILKFRQGFGRLIRGQRDRGKVVVMDPRIRTKGYGRKFVDALPFSDDYSNHY
ncbi:MAG: ATP-dependent DNA helicase [Planctomycetota bacterium]|nr:ATP-dependent DNA helicase [Planctomycetota bacterium]